MRENNHTSKGDVMKNLLGHHNCLLFTKITNLTIASFLFFTLSTHATFCSDSQETNQKKSIDSEFAELQERKRFNFGKHLTQNFSQENIIDLLVTAYYLEPYQEKLAEQAFDEACTNYFKQSDEHRIDPTTCATVQEYLEKLKNYQK